MRFKQTFTLFPRKSKRTGKSYWYYQTYDDYDVRTIAGSTGLTSRAAVMNFCIDLFSKGQLTFDNDAEALFESKELTFAGYAKPWWDWDNCPYVMAGRMRGTLTHPGNQEKLC